MPCRDYPPDPPRQSKPKAPSRAELEKEFQHNSTLAETFCTLLKRLEGDGYPMHELPKDTQQWWAAHKMRDAAREQQERQQALEKLTPRERKLLGLEL